MYARNELKMLFSFTFEHFYSREKWCVHLPAWEPLLNCDKWPVIRKKRKFELEISLKTPNNSCSSFKILKKNEIYLLIWGNNGLCGGPTTSNSLSSSSPHISARRWSKWCNARELVTWVGFNLSESLPTPRCASNACLQLVGEEQEGKKTKISIKIHSNTGIFPKFPFYTVSKDVRIKFNQLKLFGKRLSTL